MAANGLKTNIYRLFKPLAAIQFWLVQLLIPETCVIAFELLYPAKYFQNFSYFISKVSKNWWLSHYNCSTGRYFAGSGRNNYDEGHGEESLCWSLVQPYGLPQWPRRAWM